jgi:hypothetical protein
MQRRCVFMRARTDADPPQHVESVNLETTIRNGRGAGLKLDEASFELRRYPTELSTEDFYSSPEKISTLYYAEMKSLLAEATGCLPEHILMFHHQVRNQERADAARVLSDGSVTTSTPVQPYAHSIHTDSSAFHGEHLFRSMVGSMPECCRRGRFLYINVWRSIAEDPIEDNHLAVLDERSLVKPDNFIESDLYGVGYNVLQYSLSSRNARQHRWYYFPRMAREEVLLFKQWDSDTSLSGRVCFHTAIKDPSARANAPPRQSIEARALLFFPEHQPNTLPPMPVASAGSEELSEIAASAGAEKVMGGLSYIEGNPQIRAMVVGSMRSQHASGGARAVLETFCEDEQGHFGLRGASKATKARATELLLKQGAARRVDALFSGPSASRLLLQGFLQSRASSALLGALLALTVKAALARARA